MNEINIDDFAKIEIKFGKILSAEEVPEADKLIKFIVDVGEENPRQILSGIKDRFLEWKDLVDKMVPIVVNLPTRKLKGLESQGMILYAVGDNNFSPIHPSVDVPAGTKIS